METLQNEQAQVMETKQIDIFNIVKIEDKFKIVLGNAIISQREFKDIKDAEKYIKSKPYELIFNGAVYINELQRKEKQE